MTARASLSGMECCSSRLSLPSTRSRRGRALTPPVRLRPSTTVAVSCACFDTDRTLRTGRVPMIEYVRHSEANGDLGTMQLGVCVGC